LKILGIIPARFASSRFPGKPLAMIGSHSMIERVYRQAEKANALSAVVVATDDERILNHVHSFGGKPVMTSARHASGTERCAEALQKSGEFDAVINIQGDEPFISPAQIDAVAAALNDESSEMVTIIRKAGDKNLLSNPNVVKVVINKKQQALYFSRSVIPFERNAGAENPAVHYVHTGIYGYTAKTLRAIVHLPPSPLELTESLEQLRWLENGFIIRTVLTDEENFPVDTPEDLEKLKSTFGL